MPLKEDLASLASRIAGMLEGTNSLQTEEGTKNALVMPFIRALGYDVFDPNEVVPEYTADYGRRQGEKIDYAIMHGADEPIIVIECKKASEDLDAHRSQLGRYFPHVPAGIGVLTNGLVWQFFTDLDETNRMDETPFLQVDIRNLSDRDFAALGRFAKGQFDLDAIRTASEEMRYISGMRAYLEELYQQPDDAFVNLLVQQVFQGRMTAGRRETFTPMVRSAFRGFVTDQINVTLQNAIARQNAIEGASLPVDEDGPVDAEPGEETEERDGGIITTVEEQEAYELVQSLVSAVVAPERVTLNDTQQYCAVTLDGNNRKTICRFRFGPRVKRIGFNDPKNATPHQIDAIADIANYTDQLRETVQQHLNE